MLSDSYDIITVYLSNAVLDLKLNYFKKKKTNQSKLEATNIFVL